MKKKLLVFRKEVIENKSKESIKPGQQKKREEVRQKKEQLLEWMRDDQQTWRYQQWRGVCVCVGLFACIFAYVYTLT